MYPTVSWTVPEPSWIKITSGEGQWQPLPLGEGVDQEAGFKRLFRVNSFRNK